MTLRGTITPDLPLLVVAVEEEAAYLGDELPVLITGMGKVNAALALGTTLAAGRRPKVIVNLGTAGSLHDDRAGTFEVASVLQHDLDGKALHAVTGYTVGGPLRIADSGVVLATGDTFIAGGPARDRLAAIADLVDMEGYAVASAARAAGVPVRLVKHVSDNADDDATRTWRDTVDGCAKLLADWVTTHLI
jgi:adenosylhomocysteine nucleosidase